MYTLENILLTKKKLRSAKTVSDHDNYLFDFLFVFEDALINCNNLGFFFVSVFGEKLF